MLRTRFAVLALSSLSFCACAAGGGPTGTPSDGAGRDGGTGAFDGGDAASTTDGGARDANVRRDGGTVTCPTGEHACGGGCVDDQPNEPENGCRLGCGEACPAPAAGVAACTPSGACDFACEPPFRRLEAMCVCTARTCDDIDYECGAPDDGCGRPLDCGTCSSGTCMDGHCGCAPDPHEPNDGSAAGTRGPDLNDSSDATHTFTDYTLDEATDVDWLVFHVADGTDGGNPRLTVRLTGIPVGSNYDLAAFYACDSGANASSCARGTTDDATIGHGCTSTSSGAGEENVEIETDCEHISIDDDGQLFVRVTAATHGGSCAPYTLAVSVR